MTRTGLLLAGGASSRFGREKAVAPFGPGLLMDGPLQALAAACNGEVAVSARPGSGAAEIATTSDYPVLADPPGTAAGPLAGVLAGLRWADSRGGEWLATAPCDAATLTPGQVERLFDAAIQGGGAAAGASERGLEPLLAVWPVRRGLQVLQAALTDGAHPPVRSVLQQLGLGMVDGFDSVNVNAPGDLMALASAETAAEEPEHARLFAFEDDFVRTLRCIPMCVRFKLDRAGIKLSLRQWSRFTLADRRSLRLLPCDTDAARDTYRDRLVRLIEARAGEAPVPLKSAPEPIWRADAPPEAMADLAQAQGVRPLQADAWLRLGELQRYALVKLTRDKHENANLGPALKEFGQA